MVGIGEREVGVISMEGLECHSLELGLNSWQRGTSQDF